MRPIICGAKVIMLKKAEERVLDKIGKPVGFTYKGDYPRRKLHGTLTDRVTMHTRSITQMKDFFDVIDLIEFDVDGVKKTAIRFGYYICKEDGKLKWGSQTTLTEEKSILLELFKKAYERQWFRELIEECKA